MASLWRGSFVRVAVVLFVASSAWAENKTDAKTAKHFKVNWSSISYDKTLINPKLSSRRQGVSSSRLTLSCEIEIVDPDLVVGTSGEGIVTQMTDPNGRNVDISSFAQTRSGSVRMRYEGLRYQSRFVQPPKPNRWLSLIRSALKLSRRAPARPELVNELQPSRMQVQLDARLCDRAGGEIRAVKGHFYALMAESIEHVDVPFKPSTGWVRLTDEIEIQVLEAQCTSSSYRMKIETRPRGGSAMHSLNVGDLLPSRIIKDRQLIGADGKPTRGAGGYRRAPATVGGISSGGGSNMQPVKKIRFVIAVHPTHYEIPFELEHVPLPKL
ncbi:MAG: hypothetical protein P8Z79_22305 [Sedimentisphaerales bacterium]|jgi:hypothetical protein